MLKLGKIVFKNTDTLQGVKDTWSPDFWSPDFWFRIFDPIKWVDNWSRGHSIPRTFDPRHKIDIWSWWRLIPDPKMDIWSPDFWSPTPKWTFDPRTFDPRTFDPQPKNGHLIPGLLIPNTKNGHLIPGRLIPDFRSPRQKWIFYPQTFNSIPKMEIPIAANNLYLIERIHNI